MTTRSPIKPLAHLTQIQPYLPGESAAEGVWPVIKLSSNESALGPSPTVDSALRGTISNIRRYPDSGARRLRQALAAHHGVDGRRIVMSPGSEPLISLIARCYCTGGDEVLYSRHGFAIYPIAAQAAGARPVAAAEDNYRSSVDNLLNEVTGRTRIVFLANPNNPTGTYLPVQEVRRLRSGLPADVLLVLDAAYAEYVQKDDYDPGLSMVDEAEHNTLALRTFSKAYGLASLRVGWAYCPEEVADTLNGVRDVFSLSGPAQAAAKAALADEKHLSIAVAHNTQWLDWLTSQLTSLGFSVVNSVCNFVLVDLGDESKASALDRHLKQSGIVVRTVREYGLGHCLRVSVGREAENRRLVDVLKTFPGT